MRPHVAAALGRDQIGDQTVAVEIAEDERPAPGRREIVALVEREARVRVPAAGLIRAEVDLGDLGAVHPAAREVRVIGDRADVVVGEGIEMLAGLTLVACAGQHVVEVRDDAGRDEEVAAGVVIQPPGIAAALGEHFEDMARRVVAPDPRVDLHPTVVRRAGSADDGMREDPVAAVEPAVRPPHEAVERLVRVMAAPAVKEHLRLAGAVLRVLRDEEQLRRLADPDPAVSDLDAADEVEPLDEDRRLGIGAVALDVLEDEDAVRALPLRTLARVASPLRDPETAALVEAHRDRLHDPRLGGEHLGPEAGRQRHRLHGFLRREPVAVLGEGHALGRTHGRSGVEKRDEDEAEQRSHGEGSDRHSGSGSGCKSVFKGRNAPLRVH